MSTSVSIHLPFATLSPWQQIAFAAALIERMLPNYQLFSTAADFGDAKVLRNQLDLIWQWLANSTGKENVLTEKAILDEEKRVKFFEGLKKNRMFQKYVIEDILDKERELNQNISGEIEGLVASDPETVKSVLLAKSGGLKSSQNIKNQIVN
jgi:uncharacterized protein YjaG (DUF416 family)